jgi:hypothetical protein
MGEAEMYRPWGQLVVAVLLVAGVLLGSTAEAGAAGAYLTPGSTEVQASLTQIPTIDISLYQAGQQGALVQCTGFTFSFKTPKDGTTVKLTDPNMSGCTTSRSGIADTVTTSGVWKIGWESEDKARLINGGNVITVSYEDEPGCVITIRPYAAPGEGRLTVDPTDVELVNIKDPWPLTESGCLTQFTGASLLFEVALTPAVFYNS